MKILHVNTSTTGGAGIAARRIHEGMFNEGLDSHLLTLNNSSTTIPNHHVYNGPIKKLKPDYPSLTLINWFKERFFKSYSKSLSVYNKEINQKNAFKTPSFIENKNSFELFSFPDLIYDITETQIYKEVDVIHLHWVSDFLDYESFFSKNKKPVVWTLHDENPYLGGFHYEGDLIRNSETHGAINEEIRKKKINWIQNAKFAIKIVSPSYWLAEKARFSDVFKGKEVLTIRNGIDLTIFKKRDQNFCRDVFNLPYNKRIFLVASADLKNHRKGIDLILPILESEEFNNDLFVLVGSNFKEYTFNNVLALGNIHDEQLMALVYSAVDAFILPSREDNLPNTMLESIACGTPVLAFDIGDNIDFIGINGIVVENEEELKKEIFNFDRFRLYFNSIRKDFEIKNVNDQYLSCYKKELK